MLEKIVIVVAALMMGASPVGAVTQDDYVIDKYDVDVVVNEDNTS